MLHAKVSSPFALGIARTHHTLRSTHSLVINGREIFRTVANPLRGLHWRSQYLIVSLKFSLRILINFRFFILTSQNFSTSKKYPLINFIVSRYFCAHSIAWVHPFSRGFRFQSRCVRNTYGLRFQ